MFNDDNQPDPDDYFADSRMTFGEHIEDLRTHLLRALKGFLVAFLIAIPLGRPVLRIIQAPVEEQLNRFWADYYKEQFQTLQKEGTRGLPHGDEVPSFLTTKVWIDRQDLSNALGIKDLYPAGKSKLWW